jgi:hypothetical protein
MGDLTSRALIGMNLLASPDFVIALAAPCLGWLRCCTGLAATLMAATWKVSSTMGEATPCTPSHGRVLGVARTEIAEPLGLVRAGANRNGAHRLNRTRVRRHLTPGWTSEFVKSSQTPTWHLVEMSIAFGYVRS